jgi:hypothetical protein
MMAAKAKRNLGAWITFLAVLLIVSFAAMPGFEKFSAMADHIAVAIRWSLVLVLSILLVRDKVLGSESGNKGSIVQRCRRWYYGE